MSRTSNLTRQQALDLLKKYNTEPFHIQHALTVEGVMRWYAKELGYGDEVLQKCYGHGSSQCEEKIQRQKVCGRVF